MKKINVGKNMEASIWRERDKDEERGCMSGRRNSWKRIGFQLPTPTLRPWYVLVIILSSIFELRFTIPRENGREKLVALWRKWLFSSVRRGRKPSPIFFH
jgi:hypothetical protein